MFGFDTKERGDVLVVWKGSRESDETAFIVILLHLSDGSDDDRLEDWATVIVKQVDLVNDKESHHLVVSSFTAFSSHNVVLLRCAHDYLQEHEYLDLAFLENASPA